MTVVFAPTGKKRSQQKIYSLYQKKLVYLLSCYPEMVSTVICPILYSQDFPAVVMIGYLKHTDVSTIGTAHRSQGLLNITARGVL